MLKQISKTNTLHYEKCIQNFGQKTEGKRPLERPMCIWEANAYLQEIRWEGVKWIDLAQDRDKWWDLQVP
jgi:hypothetical protein